MYTLQDESVLALRLHTSACDRTSIVALRRELLGLKAGVAPGRVETEFIGDGDISLGIEEHVPSGQGKKPIWARGFDMLGYSLNSFRFSHLGFKDTVSPRGSCVIRLQFNEEETIGMMSKCEDREIKLLGLLSAAGLSDCHSLKEIPDYQWEKYAVTTLIDCILDPVLISNHIGYYHSAILNSHDVKGGEDLWELAKRIHMSFMSAKNNKKHFTDMADLNFLMYKAIDNPGLTASGSLRTAVLSVFEDPIIDNSNKLDEAIGLKDSIGCGSIHGVGPSIAIFYTIRDAGLDCSLIHPSRCTQMEQMQEFVDEMKGIIFGGWIWRLWRC